MRAELAVEGGDRIDQPTGGTTAGGASSGTGGLY